jgi:hypothetical protein
VILPGITISEGGPTSVHGQVPDTPEGRREFALAIRDLDPTCQPLSDRLANAAVGLGLSATQRLIGLSDIPRD